MEYQFETSVQFLKGVGPQLGTRLEAWGLKTLEDLVQFVPRTYQTWKKVSKIAEIVEGDFVILPATLVKVSGFRRGPQRSFELAFIDSEGKPFRGRFFRQPYHGYFERFRCPQPLWVLGKPGFVKGSLEFPHPDLREELAELGDSSLQLIPVYTETVGLNSKKIHSLIGQSFQLLERTDLWAQREFLPLWIRETYKLITRKEALRALHFPQASFEKDYQQRRTPAHRRLIFEDFFWMEFSQILKKNSYRREKSTPLPGTGILREGLRRQIPFTLTGAQERAVQEIAQEMARETPMNRLLQGDVGSGKTLVLFFAILQAIESGTQGVLMAPTEILAEQHFRTAEKLLVPLNVKVGLLTAKVRGSERQVLLESLQRGEIHCLIGTHALIEEEVQFQRLGLVVVDEQHRFGVEQRRKLQVKGWVPHLLLVTATPIPRTLAMTAYGDLEVTLLREKPPGRTPITSRLMKENQRTLFMDFLLKQFQLGRQAYFVYPLVEESEKVDLKSATEAFEKLKTQYPQIAWGLLHGKMKALEKEQVMTQFRNGAIQGLISTTVIEVGVDVPNAVIMVIEHAERFGLSQLHQLRGRVGRGALKSYCVFATGPRLSAEARQRLELMCETEDGFQIAEADLRWRGPGEFLGAKQSGLCGFRWADLLKDEEILVEAREAVQRIFQQDPALSQQDHQSLMTYWKRLPWAFTP